MDFGAARPPDEGLDLSPIREAARPRAGSVPPGFAPRIARVALEIVDLMEEWHRVRDKEKRLDARLPWLEDSPKTDAEGELFLTAIEGEAERVVYELVINQMSSTLATNYRRLFSTKFPRLPESHETLVAAMVERVAPGKPEGHLLKEIKTLEVGKMGIWPL